MKKWKRVTACVLCAVLVMQAIPQKSIAAEGQRVEEEVPAAAKFSIEYKDGSFIKAAGEVLDAEIGTIDYKEKTSENPGTVPGEIEKVSFICPKTGTGILEVEMVTDTAKPEVKINGQEATGEMSAILATRSNTNFTIKIEAADHGSGIKKVEWCEEDKEYEALYNLSPVEADPAGGWSST